MSFDSFCLVTIIAEEIERRSEGIWDEAEHQVDDHDEDAGDGVALHELAGTVHGAVELGLGRDVLSPCLRDILGDEPRVEVGVNRHLLAGHSVEGEPGGDLGDSACALCYDDEVDDDEDGEHNEADEVVVSYQDVAEGVYHLARGLRSLGSVHQHHAGRGDVEREAEERRDKRFE